MQDVEEFAREKDLEDILPLLRKGALAAQSPVEFENIDELEEHEKQNLREEITNRWKHPKILYFTIVLNSIAAAIQGWGTYTDEMEVRFKCMVAMWRPKLRCFAVWCAPLETYANFIVRRLQIKRVPTAPTCPGRSISASLTPVQCVLPTALVAATNGS